MALLRRRAVPDDVRAVPLARGERVLAWAPVTGGGTATATNHALHLSVAGVVRSLPWHEVLRAVWEAESATLVVDVAVGTHGARRERIPLDGDGGRVPETVRERVTSSIVIAQHVPLVGRSGVRVVARRVPESAELLWQLHPDAGIDLQRSDLREKADEALASVRASLMS